MTTTRPRRRATLLLVWLVIGLVGPIGLANLLVVDTSTPDNPAVGFVLFTAVAVLFGGVGAIVITKRPGNAVGWILWSVGALVGLNLAGTAYAAWSLDAYGGTLPGSVLAGWVSQWTFSPPLVLGLYLLPLLFPDGHLPSPRWRWALASAIVTIVLSGLSDMLQPGPLGNSTVPNPTGWTGDPRVLSLLTGFSQVSPLLALPIVVAAAVVRYRRGTTIERQQLKWFGATAGFSIVSLSVAATMPNPIGIIAWVLAIASLGFVPVAIGMAILRYRLFEIDRIVSRTISWAMTTGLIGALFAGLIVTLQALLAPLTSGNGLAVAASTLVAAAGFQPARRRVQAAVDHRFNRRRYDAERIIDAYAARLRGVTDLGEVGRGAIDAVGRSLGPSGAAIWIRPRREGGT